MPQIVVIRNGECGFKDRRRFRSIQMPNRSHGSPARGRPARAVQVLREIGERRFVQRDGDAPAYPPQAHVCQPRDFGVGVASQFQQIPQCANVRHITQPPRRVMAHRLVLGIEILLGLREFLIGFAEVQNRRSAVFHPLHFQPGR